MSSPRAGWLANLPLTFKLLFAFGLVYACFLATAVFVLQTFSRDSRLQKQERQQIELIRHVESAGQKMRAQQIAIRNYILDGDRRHLEVEQAARKHRDDDLAKAMELSGNGRGAELETARNAAHAWDVGIEAFLQEDGNTTVTEQRNQLGRAYLKEHSQHVSQLLEKLDRMYETEVERYVDERTLMGRYIAFAQTFMLLMLVGSVALIVVVLWLVSRLVATPIRTLSAQMTQLAEGQLDIVVAGQSRKDEVGSIARALEVFRANAIRSTENNWVKISAGEVMNALQSVDSPTAFCETLVAEVSPRIGAGIGVFFQWDEQGRELHLSGSYGFLHRKHLGLHYALGEGLTGQSAKERKRITLENVPDDYFGIHSATGESRPRHVVAQPLLLRDRLLGVFEFASFRPFTAAQQAFLDEILPAAALGLDNIRGVENTQHLLSRTQAQAEELQRSSESLRAQEEELRATNEELQGKTVELEEHAQRLSASEEELRVQAEELQASNEELRQKTETLNAQKDVLQELQRETEFKAQQLAQASQYKTDFLANMSHELRTPLNSLLILSRELADNGSGHLDPDEVEAAQVIHDSGSNLLRLINDILDLSKIEAGKMDVHLDEVEIALVGQEVQRHFRHVASDKHLAFTLDVAADVPPVLLTDRPKLQQVLNNLLGNAFKFTHSGSVALNIVMATAPLLMRVGAPTTARYVAISVTDTGIGIPEDRLESIFEAFEQVDSSTSRHYGGSGLGLAIARRLAGLLGGQLLADSDVGTGSTFTLVLPVQAPASVLAQLETAAEPSIPGLPRRGGDAPLIDWIQDDRHTLAPGEKAILTIEDDLAFARILVDMIRRKGYRALAAADGESGLELARRHRPTGILLDVMLPGMDGWSVMQHLHQDPVTASIPVHFISAVDAAEKGQALGAVGYLTKPVDRQSLTQAFDRLMEVAGKIVRRLLLVDDDRDSRLALARLLQDDRVEIDEATSGEEALRLVAERNYDCIVLDLNLDGISGTEFLQRASAQVTLPPVVIYSGQDLGREESLKLRQYTDSIVIKGERSPQRLLDEVSLFLHSIDASGRSSSGNGGESDLAGRCVLLVDDDMRNLFALSKALRARGLEVLMAQDGYKALHQLQEHPEITLVMMDIMMPGMDGYEAIGEIRKHPQWQDLPIIAITAKAMQGDRDKCLAAGANDYLAKPVDLDKLLSMIRAWLPA